MHLAHLFEILQIEKSPELTPHMTTQTTLRASITGVQFMKDECKSLLEYIDFMMDAAYAVKEDYWKSEKSKEPLAAMEVLIQHCQTLVADCRGKKEAVFTNTKKWSKRFESLKSRLDDLETLFLVSYTKNIIIMY